MLFTTVRINTLRLVDELPPPALRGEYCTPDFDAALVLLADPAHHSGGVLSAPAPVARFAAAH
ncbi:hypothetical protein [Rhodococcus opacus]|uniref:Uncharacterized protein n=1 Tax=Rhodococcus opacus (strain B4) TaxID=632772 RepID=C1B7G8_RHOOB|nr:hypothetical protein [Rhodococcus opacus]BAH51621.1 hypothetical protein ROP_33740 [Rhodococcus opacus B4]